VRVDRLLRFGSLESDLADLVRDLGLPEAAFTEPLRHANVSQRRLPGPIDQLAFQRGGPERGLSEASRTRIRDRYRDDLELLAAGVSV
jgi:hypothetical protein